MPITRIALTAEGVRVADLLRSGQMPMDPADDLVHVSVTASDPRHTTTPTHEETRS